MSWVPYTCPPGVGAPSNLCPGCLSGLSSSRPYSVICLDLSFRKSLLAALERMEGWGRGWGERGKPLRWLLLSLEFKTSTNFCYGTCWQEAFIHIPIGFSSYNSRVSLLRTWRNWLVNGGQDWWMAEQGLTSHPAQSRCFSWLCSPRILVPWITCYLKAGAASDHFCILHGTCERRWPEKSAPPGRVFSFFLWGIICLLHWLDGLETAWWSDLGLGLPPILPAGPGRRNSVYRSGLQRVFCQSIDQENCKYFSSDFSRVKSLLHYSFNCSKKLSLFMPEGININHYLRAGIGLLLCKYHLIIFFFKSVTMVARGNNSNNKTQYPEKQEIATPSISYLSALHSWRYWIRSSVILAGTVFACAKGLRQN